MMRMLALSILLAASVAAQTYDTPGISGGSGSGRVLISELTASDSASLDFDSVFDSTYDRYEIEIVGVLPATANANLTANVRSGGTYQTGGDYDTRVFCESAGSGSTDTISGGSATVIYILGCDAANFGLEDAATGGGYIALQVFEPDSTAKYFQVYGQGNFINEPTGVGAERAMYVRSSGIWKNTAAVTGIRFQFSSGNIASGTIRVWGLPSS